MKIIEVIKYHIKNTPKIEIAKILLMNLHFQLFWYILKGGIVKNINNFEKRVYSQNGEDGILQIIFYKIGTTNKNYVEFGVEDTFQCNTKYLKDFYGWNGLWMDLRKRVNSEIKKERVTKENIEMLLRKYNVPKKFDLLSIDIDGNDYWVWKALKNYNPRVVVIEYNSTMPPPLSRVIKYDPEFILDGTNYFGASLSALVKLAKQKGYELIGCEGNGVNAFFVKRYLLKGNFVKKSIEELYKRPKYGVRVNGRFMGFPKSTKEMVAV